LVATNNMDLTQQQKLALELAETLKDHDSLTLYQQYSEKYSEEFLRRILERVLSIPKDKIRKSRGALFTFLVNQHEQQSSNDPWD